MVYSNTPQGSTYGTNLYNYPQYTPMVQPTISPMPRNVLSGRIVDNVEDIAIWEVPQDKSLGFFPKKDGTRIYAKTWDDNGNIHTIEYVPVDQDTTTQIQEPITVNATDGNKPSLLDIMNTLDDIVDLLTSSQKNQNGSENDKNSKED